MQLQPFRELPVKPSPDTSTMAAVRHQSPFRVRIDDDQEPSVISVEGELDSFTAGELRDGFSDTVGHPAVVIDIREVPFVDSAGLGALVGGVRRLREAGGTVALCCTSSSVLRLLAVTGFDRMIPVTDTPADAVEVIAEARAAALAN
jgi:anti-anti-sigma factor